MSFELICAAEAREITAKAGNVKETIRCTKICCVAVESSTTKNPINTIHWTLWIFERGFGVKLSAIPIGNPFPQIGWLGSKQTPSSELHVGYRGSQSLLCK